VGTKAFYEFGPFRLDRHARVLTRDGQIVPLTPKVLELLVALVDKQGQVVAKDQLIGTVWPDTFVEESNLTSNISILRKQLGEHPDGGEYIETIPKRGYRFLAAVHEVQEQEADRIAVAGLRRAIILPMVASAVALSVLALFYWKPWRLLVADPVPPIRTLAVLPLANLSGDPAQEYFADGMTEAVTNDLAQIGSLTVISRISVMQYKNTKKTLPQIAAELKADAVVVGSVGRSSQRVRITAELIHARMDRHLWAKSYERNVGDILDLESEVARAIVNEIQAKVTPPERQRLSRSRQVGTAAYEAYLKGRHYWYQDTGDAIWKSIDYFEEAVKLDPGYATAYAGLADAWLSLQHLGLAPSEETQAKALEAAGKALQIDDTLAEAHSAMAAVKAHEWNWEAADRETQRAIDLNPGYAPVHYTHANRLRHRGRLAESMAEARRALELDPLSPFANEELADVFLTARQYDLAVEQYRKTLELYPDHAPSRDGLGWAYALQGMYDEAVAEITKSLASYGEDPELSPELAYLYAMRGHQEAARKILARLLRMSKGSPVAPHHFAIIYVGLGRKTEALDALEAACREHSQIMLWLKQDARFDGLRAEPRFQVLIRRVGL
jgi:TolB-like protein/DNA-binding winged helix-turn-helix (wHTH) protein/Tfp pilus assembly protein PilF